MHQSWVPISYHRDVILVVSKNGFGSINAAADCSSASTGEKDLLNGDKFIFLYEDFEGDRMLVGDVPWE